MYVIANQSADWCGNPPVFPGTIEKRTGDRSSELESQ